MSWGWDSTHERLQGIKLETYLRGCSLTESQGYPFKQGNLGKDFQCTDIQRLLKLWSIDPNSWACNRTWHHLHNTNFACLQNEEVLVILENCTNIFDKSLGSQAVYSRIRFSPGSWLYMKLSGWNPSCGREPKMLEMWRTWDICWGKLQHRWFCTKRVLVYYRHQGIGAEPPKPIGAYRVLCIYQISGMKDSNPLFLKYLYHELSKSRVSYQGQAGYSCIYWWSICFMYPYNSWSLYKEYIIHDA